MASCSGIDVTTLEIFLVGVAAGAAILWGFSILKWGTKRGLAQRRSASRQRNGSTRRGQKREDDPTTPDERV